MQSENINALVSAKNAYENSVRSGNGIRGHKESLKNVLFNNYEDLVALASGTSDAIERKEADALKDKIASLERDVESLTKALDEADVENANLKKKLKARNAENTGE